MTTFIASISERLKKMVRTLTYVVAFIGFAIPAQAAYFTGLGDLPGGEFNSNAQDISADGKTVVGSGRSSATVPSPQIPPGGNITNNFFQPFRWTQSTGMVGLGDTLSQFGIFGGGASGVSGDGDVVVGTNQFRAFRWTQSTGLVTLGQPNDGFSSSFANAVSADGTTMVGTGSTANGSRALRWTQSSGLVSLGEPPVPIFGSQGADVSADGSVVVGSPFFGILNSSSHAWHWTESTGFIELGHLLGGTLGSSAGAVTADGKTLVGSMFSNIDTREAFRLTPDTGELLGLGDLQGGIFDSEAKDISDDGQTIVGQSETANGDEAFIWDPNNGMRHFQSVLMTDFGVDLPGWTLKSANGISADGLSIVGSGINPDGNPEAWLARLDAKPVPEPTTFLLLGSGLVGLIGWRIKNST